MFKKMLLASMLSWPILSAGLGCASHEADANSSVPKDVGTVVMSLTQTSGSNTYRLTGVVTPIYKVDGPSQPMSTGVPGPSIDLGASDTVVASLRAGNYDLNLNSWRMYLMTANGPVDVSDRTDWAPGTNNIVNVNVVAGQSVSAGFRFRVNGVVVIFDPCTLPASVACSSGDNDGDGINNGIECSTPQSCADSDGDGVPDVNDTDSDEDGISDLIEWTVSHDGRHLDPCIPNAYADACTNPATGNVAVDVTVEEHCAATGQDSCTFTPDAGADASAGSTDDASTNDAGAENPLAGDFHQNSITIVNNGVEVLGDELLVSGTLPLRFSIVSTPEVIGPRDGYFTQYGIFVEPISVAANFSISPLLMFAPTASATFVMGSVSPMPAATSGAVGYVRVKVSGFTPAPGGGGGSVIETIALRTLKLVVN
jgi:hypothetical protein